MLTGTSEQSFSHLFPYGIFRAAAIGHDAFELRRAQFGESGIARRFDTRQTLQHTMQEFHIAVRARFQSGRELRVVDRETLADPAQRVVIQRAVLQRIDLCAQGGELRVVKVVAQHPGSRIRGAANQPEIAVAMAVHAVFRGFDALRRKLLEYQRGSE